MNGSITKSKNKYRYVIETGIDPKSGKRKQVTKSGFKTKTEAKSNMRKKIIELENNFRLGIDPEDMSLGCYLTKWLTRAKNNISYKTFLQYSYIVNYVLIPNLGKIPLENLTPMIIQNFYDEQLQRIDINSTTVRHFHIVLHVALNEAVKWHLISYNAADKVDKPRRCKKIQKVYNDEELLKLLNALKGKSAYYHVLIAVTTGIRVAELCGLRWENIDFKTKNIFITEQLQVEDNKLILVNLKTPSSKRKIALLDITYEALKELKIKYDKNKIDNSEYFQDLGFVISNIDGTPYSPAYISKNYNRTLTCYKNSEGKNLCEQLGISYITFHDLRHTHATLLLKAGINPKIVAERLGHSSVNITLDTYSHVLPDMQRTAVDKLNRIINKCDTNVIQ